MKREVDERLPRPLRRQVLQAAAGVVAMTLTMQLPAIAARETERELLARLLAALGESVDRPVVLNHAALEHHLTRILRAPANTVESSTLELKQRVRANIEADYRAGELRVIDGVWLSATEAHCLELLEQVRAA